MKAAIKVKTISRPISGATMGYRIQAAVPNQDGNCFGWPTTSFRKEYLISEKGDFINWPTEDQVTKFLVGLEFFGVTEFEAA